MTTLEERINRQGLLRQRQGRPTLQPGVLPPTLYADQIPTEHPPVGELIPFAPNIPRRVPQDVPQRKDEVLIRPEDRRYMKTIIRDMEQNIPELFIESAIFSFYSNEEIEKMSVAEIKYPTDEGLNSVNDPRMGSTKYDTVCSTCEMQDTQCTGHFGHIRLVSPIYNPLAFDTIIRVLRSVCNSCGGLFFTKDEIENNTYGFMSVSANDRLKIIEKMSLNKECIRPHIPVSQFIGTACAPDPQEIISEIGPVAPCVPNPKYISESSKNIGRIMYRCIYGDDLETEHVRSINDVFNILNRITDEEANILGFDTVLGAHPRNFIIKNLVVIPPCSRPVAVMEGIEKPHYYTDVYITIVKNNNEAAQNKNVNPNKYIDAIDRVSSEYRKLVVKGEGASSRGIPFKSIMDMIQGKEGLIRSSLMGKRVNFAARAIIGPDPTLRFGQIGLPRELAKQLTVPEIITSSNIDYFTSLIQKGEINRVKIGSGRNRDQIKSVSATSTHTLRPGDTVHRWLRDGDYVIINRQPTLHKLGMMGVEVKVMDGLTTRLHMSYTSPFNADFDGDEMNIHVPQTPEAMEEVKNLMGVKKCLMNAQNNMPAMALVFDSLLVYLMTQPEVMIDEDVWMDSLMIMTSQDQLVTLDKRLEKHYVPKFSGRALFSALLPEDFYYISKDDNNSVIIVDGILISGYISKKQVGISSGSIIIELFKRYGEERTVNFLTDAPWIVNKYLLQRGFTVGLKDCMPLHPKSHDILRERMAEVRKFAESVKINLEDPNELRRQENAIRARIDRATQFGNRVMDEAIPPDNNLKIAAVSGAKGSNLNIAQITTAIGQQALFGERLKPTITGGTRCLPYFKEGDTDPAARGYCYNSFSTGLSPAELFFHQTAGREGLIDTAVKTGKIGYSHRRITKMLEDLIVGFDGAVYNSNKDIIQFAYGEDGLNGGELQKLKIGTDTIASFINIGQMVGQINASYGYF